MSDDTPDLFPENGLGNLPADSSSEDECVPCSQPERVAMLRDVAGDDGGGGGEEKDDDEEQPDFSKVRVEYVVQQLYVHSCCEAAPPFTILPPRDMNEIKMVAHIVWALSVFRSTTPMEPVDPPPPGPKVCDYIVANYRSIFEWHGPPITAQKMFFWFHFMFDTLQTWFRLRRQTSMVRSIFDTFHFITECKLGQWLQRDGGWNKLFKRCVQNPIELENVSPSLFDK